MKSPTITTGRLVLKTLDIADAPTVFAYRSDPEIARFQSFCPAELSEVQDFILRSTAAFNVEDTWFQLGIYREGALIGDLGIHFIGPHNSQCEIGYTLAKSAQGQGYGQEAVRAAVSHLFDSLKKHRITASLDPRNTASIKLLEQLGFRREGCFVKSYYNQGVWEDDLVYAVLGEEW